jgi:hypothetical protein
MGSALREHRKIPGCSTAMAHPAMSFENQSTNELPLLESAEGISNMRNRERRAGNYPAKDTRDIPAFSITHGDWLKRVSEAMHQEAGTRPGKAKYIAELVECSPKTAQSWLDGETAPAGILDLRAMNRLSVYAALKREIAAMETGMDPRLQAKYDELHRLTLELADGNGMHP